LSCTIAKSPADLCRPQRSLEERHLEYNVVERAQHHIACHQPADWASKMVVAVQLASICIRPSHYNRWQGEEVNAAQHTLSVAPGYRMPGVQHWCGLRQEAAVDVSIRVSLDTSNVVHVVLVECKLGGPLRLGIVVPGDSAAQPNVEARMRAGMLLDADALGWWIIMWENGDLGNLTRRRCLILIR